MSDIVLVCGPGCAGKSSLVRSSADAGDLIVDHDALVAAITTAPSHQAPEHLHRYGSAMRRALLDVLPFGQPAWIVATAPTFRERVVYSKQGARVVMLTASATVLHQRADALGRPQQWHAWIDEWLSTADRHGVTDLIDTSERWPEPLTRWADQTLGAVGSDW